MDITKKDLEKSWISLEELSRKALGELPHEEDHDWCYIEVDGEPMMFQYKDVEVRWEK